ncbi:MAG: hypothetical protein H0T79_06665 [Deltaproteobacteria bacterium]|nr:hypothetical protein [Deltaproteobacteria bacterium]
MNEIADRLLVVGDVRIAPQMIAPWADRHDTLVCASPLDLIDLMELHGRTISTVVLVGSGRSVTNDQLAQFVHATYPWVRVVCD